MSIEEIREIAHRFSSADSNDFQQLKESGGKDMYTPDFVLHATRGDVDLKTFIGRIDILSIAFPDFKYAPEDIIVEGDKAVVRTSFTGTHLGEFMGLPPSGKKVRNEGIAIYRISNGKIAEAWIVSDSLGLMQQLGAIPSR